MRAPLFVLAAVIASCSSSNDEPTCTIAGTYSMTAAPESQTEGCADLPDPPAQTTITITARPPDVAGPDFAIEIQGAQGACAGDLVAECKVQAKCDVAVTDATDPANNKGTLQFSWTFDAKGFSGINSGSIPPATSVPKGCSFTSKASATRR